MCFLIGFSEPAFDTLFYADAGWMVLCSVDFVKNVGFFKYYVKFFVVKKVVRLFLKCCLLKKIYVGTEILLKHALLSSIL